MLGFATVDMSVHDRRLTVWLTSIVARQAYSYAGHTNAVSFDLAEKAVSRRAWSMACDRYVVLSDRTPLDHPVFAGWGVVPCDLSTLAEEAKAAQGSIMRAFAEYKANPGKAGLAEPVLPAIPLPLDRTAADGDDPAQVTLTLADYVKRVWMAWIGTERERVKGWRYMPGGREDEKPSVLPAEFVRQAVIQPVRAWHPELSHGGRFQDVSFG